MGKIFRHLKTLHSWMGLIALPWVILFGLSGLYLNHPQLVSQILPDSAYGAEAEMFASLDVPLTPETAANIARQYWPESPMNAIRQIKYHGFDAVEFTRGAGRIIVAKETGHYYTKTNFQNVLYSPQGEAVDRKIYWNYLLGVFHRNGWFSQTIGTILADITAIILIAFGLSGITLWYLPRHKRIKKDLVERFFRSEKRQRL
ncbi:MAG: PepSY domain-containing protein [Oceanospirillaceae bacterium]|nr:PepSY domain-containing protein [Oceanospirillaceae bacterium]